MEKIRIGLLGPAGTYTDEATQKYLREAGLEESDIQLVYKNSIADVIKGVGNEYDTGIIPIENLLNGPVLETLDNLYKNGAKIKGEIVIPIHICLAALDAETPLKKIMSKQDAIAQCKRYLEQNYKNIAKETRDSTAAAMQEIKEKNLLGVGALGPRVGAKKYDLTIRAENIEDDENNITRFVILGKEDAKPTGYDKTTVAIKPYENKPGLLYDILKPLKKQNINLTALQSRPTGKRMGTYIFYIELEGHRKDKVVKKEIKSKKKPK